MLFYNTFFARTNARCREIEFTVRWLSSFVPESYSFMIPREILHEIFLNLGWAYPVNIEEYTFSPGPDPLCSGILLGVDYIKIPSNIRDISSSVLNILKFAVTRQQWKFIDDVIQGFTLDRKIYALEIVLKNAETADIFEKYFLKLGELSTGGYVPKTSKLEIINHHLRNENFATIRYILGLPISSLSECDLMVIFNYIVRTHRKELYEIFDKLMMSSSMRGDMVHFCVKYGNVELYSKFVNIRYESEPGRIHMLYINRCMQQEGYFNCGEDVLDELISSVEVDIKSFITNPDNVSKCTLSRIEKFIRQPYVKLLDSNIKPSSKSAYMDILVERDIIISPEELVEYISGSDCESIFRKLIQCMVEQESTRIHQRNTVDRFKIMNYLSKILTICEMSEPEIVREFIDTIEYYPPRYPTKEHLLSITWLHYLSS